MEDTRRYEKRAAEAPSVYSHGETVRCILLTTQNHTILKYTKYARGNIKRKCSHCSRESTYGKTDRSISSFRQGRWRPPQRTGKTLEIFGDGRSHHRLECQQNYWWYG